jgi:hypothetical protein
MRSVLGAATHVKPGNSAQLAGQPQLAHQCSASRERCAQHAACNCRQKWEVGGGLPSSNAGA